jgi:hypothetical protein
MTRKKRKPKPLPSKQRRRVVRLERELAALEAQIARLEKDPHLDLAEQDHFVLWRRPTLFVSWPSELLQ